jgi:hypothetical protein
MIRFVGCVAVAAIVTVMTACGSGTPERTMKELQRTKAGALDVVLLGPSDALPQGKGFAILEFRDSSGGLVDVGTVKVNATMAMAGMSPMIGGSDVKPTPAPGRYEIATDFSMAGSWQLAIEWDGPRGRGSARMPGTVR